MPYQEGKRILEKNKMPNINPNARRALLNQVKLHDGAESAMALDKSTRNRYKGISGLKQFDPRAGRGNGNAQGGIGDPVPCKEEEGFKRVGPGKFRKTYN